MVPKKLKTWFFNALFSAILAIINHFPTSYNSNHMIDTLRTHRRTILLICLAIIAATFLRTWNLQHTARFIWDESSDLVNMHRIWVEKDITLIGPISESGHKVFGSLTYYLYLPFAILQNFHPLGPVWGAAFWGLVTAFVFSWFIRRIIPEAFPFAVILSVIWFPLLQSSRWAWNPHLVLLWIAISSLLLTYKHHLFTLLAGIALGLTIHHHYIAAFTIIPFIISFIILRYTKARDWLAPLLLTAGVFFSISPFVLFDLTHPPGLFLTRILYFNQLADATTSTNALVGLWHNYFQFAHYIIPVRLLAYLAAAIIPVIVYFDLKNKNLPANLLSFIWIVHLILLTFLSAVYQHYFLPAILIFATWMFIPRKDIAQSLAFILYFTILLASIFTLPQVLTHTDWQSNIAASVAITDLIQSDIQTNNLQNPNLAVIASDDPNLYGRRYRDLLTIRDVTLKDRNSYHISDNLYLITTSSPSTFLTDPAAEIAPFRDGIIKQSWQIPDSPWTVYRIDKY